VIEVDGKLGNGNTEEKAVGENSDSDSMPDYAFNAMRNSNNADDKETATLQTAADAHAVTKNLQKPKLAHRSTLENDEEVKRDGGRGRDLLKRKEREEESGGSVEQVEQIDTSSRKRRKADDGKGVPVAN
jgi:hypothetical protein